MSAPIKRPRKCNLPPGQANSYKGYAAHLRAGEVACVRCTAEASKAKSESNRRRAAVRRETIRLVRNAHPRVWAKAEAEAEAKYPKPE